MKHRPATRVLRSAATAILLAASAAPASAQMDVMRDTYGFFGSALDVEVATEAPGRIRLIRGQRARIEVAGRAPDGFTSAALGGRGVRRLTLTALASGPVDFVVSVPEDVRVRVRWEGSNRSELFGTLTHSATYAWESGIERPAFETLRPSRDPAPRAAAATPRIVDITRAERLQRLTVRLGEESFSLSPATLLDRSGGAEHLRLVAPHDGDITLDVPAGETFTLRLDGVDAIVVERGAVRLLCESVLSQSLPDGRRWLTLTPAEGCDRAAPRHTPPPRTTTARRS